MDFKETEGFEFVNDEGTSHTSQIDSVFIEISNIVNDLNMRVLAGSYHTIHNDLTELDRITFENNIVSELIRILPADNILNLIKVFNSRPIDPVFYDLMRLFTDLSFFDDLFNQTFIEKDGMVLINNSRIPKEDNYQKIYFRFIRNLSATHAIYFDKPFIIHLLQGITRLSLTSMREGSSSMINFFRFVSFDPETFEIIIEVFYRLFKRADAIIMENIGWCLYSWIRSNEFIINSISNSKFMDLFLQSLNGDSSPTFASISLSVFSYICINIRSSILDSLYDSVDINVVTENFLCNENPVLITALRFIINYVTVGGKFIEAVLDRNIHGLSLEMFDLCDRAVKIECGYLWLALEEFGNSDQLVIEQPIFIEKIMEALELDDSDLVLRLLQTVIKACNNNPELGDSIDQEVIEELANNDNGNEEITAAANEILKHINAGE